MHINSLTAYYEEKERLHRRQQNVLSFLENQRVPMTDRQIMFRMGYLEPNAVRPRITELIEKGFLEECGKVKCLVTKKNVRTVRIKARVQEQMEML